MVYGLTENHLSPILSKNSSQQCRHMKSAEVQEKIVDKLQNFYGFSDGENKNEAERPKIVIKIPNYKNRKSLQELDHSKLKILSLSKPKLKKSLTLVL